MFIEYFGGFYVVYEYHQPAASLHLRKHLTVSRVVHPPIPDNFRVLFLYLFPDYQVALDVPVMFCAPLVIDEWIGNHAKLVQDVRLAGYHAPIPANG